MCREKRPEPADDGDSPLRCLGLRRPERDAALGLVVPKSDDDLEGSGFEVNGLLYITRVFSGDTGLWNTGTSLLEQMGTPEPNGDGTETVRLRVLSPVNSSPSLMIRLEVNLL